MKMWPSLLAAVALIASLSAPRFAMAQGEPSLTIGSKAPALDIEHWVSNGQGKFQQVKDFEPGKVYVVEFWATWCGPCVMSMPHLAQTQKNYASKGVQIISVSDEDRETVDEFLAKEVRSMDDEEDEGEATETSAKQTYADLTGVYCLTCDPDGSVHKDYMEAARQNGIPTCFIVGKTGLVEWIGHPMQMDEPLEKVVGGSWDRDAFAAEMKRQEAAQAMFVKFARKMQAGSFDDAAAILDQITESMDDPEILNSISWQIYEIAAENDEFPKVLIKAATAAAEKAVAADPENGMILDTLAHLVHLNGELDRAIELQTKAVKNPGPEPQPIQDFLDQLKKEKAERDGR